jgi:CRISPR/Cas system-associated exonuclease Cas4 (RecB family)
MIHVSATNLKDFMSCPSKLYYRLYGGLEAMQPTREMAMGSLVHEVIEKYWDDKELAYKQLGNLMVSYNLDAGDTDEVINYLEVFYEKFAPLCANSDQIEKRFEVKYSDNALIVGRYDRIIGDAIIDWKTGRTPPKNIDNDVQFLLYYSVYRKYAGRLPSKVIYASLTSGNLISLNPDKRKIDVLYNEIIPAYLHAIERNDFPHTGLIGTTCYRCGFREACWNELDSGRPYNKQGTNKIH